MGWTKPGPRTASDTSAKLEPAILAAGTVLPAGGGWGVLAASWGWVAARPGEQSRAHSGQHQEAEAGSPELRVRFAESTRVQGGVGSV